MFKSLLRLAALAGAALLSAGNLASAQETIRMGIVGPMTGNNAVMGTHWRQGIEAYLAQHGDVAGGRKIEIVYRDTGGDPAKAKQLVQELVVRDKASFVGGFGLSPEAAASASIINQADAPNID